ncbi:proteasome-associated protein ECM29, partial [Tanacetum coccineum]
MFPGCAGIAIRPHLSELVVCMLESLSSLEDQALNYVERHAENAGIQTEKLENLRISIAKGSPLWETLSLGIEAVDDQSLEEERSGASKRAFANSCAFVLKYTAPSQVHKLIEETAALHSGDRNSQIVCALLLKSYASTASDILSGYYATVVPVIFLT